MRFAHTLIVCLFCLGLYAQTSHNMQLCSIWDPGYAFNDVWGFESTSGKEYAVIGSAQKISVVDVTNAYNPFLAGEVSPGMSSDWRDIKTYGNYIYGVSEAIGEGLVVMNTLNLVFGTISISHQSTTHFDRAHNIFIDEPNARLYVVGARKGNAHKNIIVYDLSANPGVPTHLSTTTLTGGYVHDVYVRDNIAYCSHGYFGFGVYDMTNPSAPIELATQTTNGYNHSSWLSTNGDYAFICEELPPSLPILTIDLTDISNNDIPVVASFKEPLLAPTHVNNRPHNPFVKGNYLYVSYYQDGVVVFDISDPLNPFRVAYFDTSNNTSYSGFQNVWGVYPYLSSGKIIASDQTQGLYIMELLFDIPLSVDQNNFAAVAKTSAVHINWQTNNGANDEMYEVQKSRAADQFETVEEVVAEGIQDITSTYTVVDHTPYVGVNYYRLKITDQAGQVEFTNPVEVNYTSNKISIFPTLLREQHEINIQFLEIENESYAIELLNVTGEVVFSKNNIKENIAIPTGQFSDGMYVLNLVSLKTNNTTTKKILIQR